MKKQTTLFVILAYRFFQGARVRKEFENRNPVLPDSAFKQGWRFETVRKAGGAA
jgi:hypothetical protein